METINISDEAVRVAAEAVVDESMRWLGRDLGTIHRDDIVRAGLVAAYPIIAAAARSEGWDSGYDAGYSSGYEDGADND